MAARWIQALADWRAPSLDVFSSFVRFSVSSPRFGGALSIVGVRVEVGSFRTMLLFNDGGCCSHALVLWGLSTTTSRLSTTTSWNTASTLSIGEAWSCFGILRTNKKLLFGTSQRYSCTFMPYSPFLPCQMCGVAVRNSSIRKMSLRTSSQLALQLKSSVFFTTGLSGYHSFVSSRTADVCGVALKATNSVNSRFFSTAYGKKLRFLISNKSSFINPNINREDGGAAHRYFHRSERRQSTLAACSTIADEASTSTSKCSESGTGTKKDIAKNKNSGGSKKEVSTDVKEKKVSTKKKSSSTKTSKSAANTTEKASAKQEEKKADTSKSKKGVGSSKERKTVTSSKKSLEAKESAAIAAAEANNYMKTTVDASGSERRPLVPLYPPLAKSVVVVESVTKAKVIQQYLGDMYEVLPSYGHVRDLARRSRSVRPEDDFSMVWEVPNGAWTCLKSIKVALKGAENLILASDPDREGEAIAWHIKEMLEQNLACHVTVARVVFHEITEDAIKNALMSPRYIDMDLVNAYLARRSLDYLIGFAISPLLWRKLPGCQSAGRVQSAALSVVCDRETEIEKFSPQEYWTADTEFETQCSDSSKGICLTSWIKHLNSKKLDQLSISSQEEARALEKRIYSCQFELIAKVVFLFINVSVGQISHGAAEDIRSLVKQRIYGIGYCETQYLISLNIYNPSIVLYVTMFDGMAGELSASLIGVLDEDSLKLYTLIWRRTMACQMEASRTELIQVGIGNPEGDMIFHSSASRLDFKGYQAVYEDTEASGSSENPEGETAHQDNFEALSKLEMKDLVSPVNVNLEQHFTKPLSRYSEGALIKKMEELGIGRPSTYASIMRVLQDRKYVTVKSRVLHPEFRGRMVSAFLSHLFSEIVDYSFTANMETEKCVTGSKYAKLSSFGLLSCCYLSIMAAE
uniref:DNA topoisomerase n=1 Tax=Aegilops tauschii TaxID=37682 RepID=M8AWA1_AEGTA